MRWHLVSETRNDWKLNWNKCVGMEYVIWWFLVLGRSKIATSNRGGIC